MCAAGPFIPDELYSPDLEGVTVPDNTDKASRFGLLAKQVKLCRVLEQGGVQGPEAFNLLARIQVVHDVHEPDQWRLLLGEIAADYKLDAAVIDTVRGPV
jgi:hypothetical protein